MVYVHVPFCKTFCTYCDFYSERSSEFGPYLLSLEREAESRRAEIASGTLKTLYIGGGTPSLLPIDAVRRIVEAVNDGPYREFTFEANPEDIQTAGYVDSLLELGVNRISMGVQSLDDDVLKWMGRRHDALRARKAYALLRERGVPSVSLDLIFGIGGVPRRSVEATVRGFIELRPDHISAYQLGIEEGSDLARLLEAGRYEECGEDECADQYAMICSLLSEAGYHHYEISNWALPGHEAVHNSAYWSREPYVGLGPGAHSLSRRDGVERRSWNSKDLSDWTSSGETLGAEEIREETVMLGLRRDIGVEIDGRTVKIKESDWFKSDSIIADLV